MCTHQRLRSALASAQSDQSSLCAQWVAKQPSFLHVDSEDSDQTWRIPSLIRVFAGGIGHFVGFVVHWLIQYLKLGSLVSTFVIFFCKQHSSRLIQPKGSDNFLTSHQNICCGYSLEVPL